MHFLSIPLLANLTMFPLGTMNSSLAHWRSVRNAWRNPGADTLNSNKTSSTQQSPYSIEQSLTGAHSRGPEEAPASAENLK
jgi:hypothetical protein